MSEKDSVKILALTFSCTVVVPYIFGSLILPHVFVLPFLRLPTKILEHLPSWVGAFGAIEARMRFEKEEAEIQ